MKKFFQNFNLLGVIMLGLCTLLGVGGLSGAVMADGNAVAIDGGEGGTTISHGFRGSLETSDIRRYTPEMIEDPVDQNLVKIRPYDTPLDTILRYAGSMKTNNFEFGWYSIGTRELNDKVESFTVNANADPTAVRGTLKVKGNADLFDETDTIYVPSVAGADGEPLMLYVYQKDLQNSALLVTVAEDQMTKDATSGAYTIPALADDTPIFALGRAAAEKDVVTPAVSFLPKKSKGYCQIFKCQIAQTAYEKLMDKEIKFDISEVEEQALYEFRRRMEGTFLFGHGQKVYDPLKKTYVYTTAGLVTQIKKYLTVNSTAVNGNNELVDLTKAIFTGNSGAKERFAICGSDAVAKISKLQSIEKHQDAVKTEVIWGITWSKIVTNFGTLNLVHHALLDEYGFSSKMIVIDPQFIKKWQLTNFERQQVDAKALTIMNGDITIFTEASGVAVYNPDAHCIVDVA